MPTYKATIHSPHPQQTVFQYLANFQSVKEWDPSVWAAQALTDPYRTGAQFSVTLRFLGRESVFTYETIAFEEPHRVVLQAKNKTVTSLDTITIQPHPEGGTTVTYLAKLSLHGIFQIVTPVIAFFFQRLGDNAKRGLTQALNGATLDL